MKHSLSAWLALATTALLAAAGPAQAQQKRVPAQSEIVFVSKQMGVPVEGRFTKFDAQVAFDPKQPATSKIGFTVDLASASLGAAETEAEVAKPGWFNTKAFPQATFQSTAIKALGGGKFEVAGKLGIKGNSRDVLVPATVTQSGGNTLAAGSFTIKRLEYKIGEGEWNDPSLVADEVQVRFKLTLTGVGPL
jgi:polyisoprenoid-binding protein YceI